MHKNTIHILCLAAGLLIIFFWGISESHAQMLRGRMYRRDKVTVILDSQLSTKKLKKEEKVGAHVKNQIKKGSDTYVYADEPVWAHVKLLKKPGIYGKKAELIVSFDSTKSTGGTTIPLFGEIPFKGKGKGILPYVLFPLGWLFKGSHIETTGKDVGETSVSVSDTSYLNVYIKP